MKSIYIFILLSALFSLSSSAEIACSKTRPCSKDDLKSNVTEAFEKCRSLIKSIDGVTKDVFEPSISFYHLKTKAALKELNSQLSFTRYLDMVNDLIRNNLKGRSDNFKLIADWADTGEKGLFDLGMKVSEDLRARGSYCKQPVDFIKNHVQKLIEAVKNKT